MQQPNDPSLIVTLSDAITGIREVLAWLKQQAQEMDFDSPEDMKRLQSYLLFAKRFYERSEVLRRESEGESVQRVRSFGMSLV